MRKPDSLRAMLSESVPYLRENPENLHVWVEKGAIIATGEKSFSFEEQYQIKVLVVAYPLKMVTLTLPILLWLRRYQSDVLFNPDANKKGIAFEDVISSNGTAGILLTLHVTEATRVKEIDGQLLIESVDEPYDDPFSLLPKWENIIKEQVRKYG